MSNEILINTVKEFQSILNEKEIGTSLKFYTSNGKYVLSFGTYDYHDSKTHDEEGSYSISLESLEEKYFALVEVMDTFKERHLLKEKKDFLCDWGGHIETTQELKYKKEILVSLIDQNNYSQKNRSIKFKAYFTFGSLEDSEILEIHEIVKNHFSEVFEYEDLWSAFELIYDDKEVRGRLWGLLNK